MPECFERRLKAFEVLFLALVLRADSRTGLVPHHPFELLFPSPFDLVIFLFLTLIMAGTLLRSDHRFSSVSLVGKRRSRRLLPVDCSGQANG